MTDPASQWTAAPGGPAFYAYSTNYLIDVQAGIIIDVDASPAHRTKEVNATKKMIERVEGRFDITPNPLIGDTAYGTAAMLGWMVDAYTYVNQTVIVCAWGSSLICQPPVHPCCGERMMN